MSINKIHTEWCNKVFDTILFISDIEVYTLGFRVLFENKKGQKAQTNKVFDTHSEAEEVRILILTLIGKM